MATDEEGRRERTLGDKVASAAKWTVGGAAVLVGVPVLGAVTGVYYVGKGAVNLVKATGREVKKVVENPPGYGKLLRAGILGGIIVGTSMAVRSPTMFFSKAGAGAEAVVASVTYTADWFQETFRDARLASANERAADLERQLQAKEEQLSMRAGLRSASLQPLESRTGGARGTDALEAYLDRSAVSYDYAIRVDKDQNTVNLLRSDGRSFSQVASYRCTTGVNQAPKSRSGDRASPEGIFRGDAHFGGSVWNHKYTPGFIDIKLPDGMGSGIYVTGAFDSSIRKAISQGLDVSNGGIVLDADDFYDLQQRIRSGESGLVVLTSRRTRDLVDYS